MFTSGLLSVHDEANIQTTVVLLKALAQRGGGHYIEVPVIAQIGGEEGWRLAAIQFLDKAEARKQYQERFVLPVLQETETRKEEGRWQELNERWDWEERKETDGKLYRELRNNS